MASMLAKPAMTVRQACGEVLASRAGADRLGRAGRGTGIDAGL